ncbi:LCP family protein [Fonticella tunisiensis]|uniref:LytR family transcriptional attenuator n=1 Tax=Fonticella tunisiensis TaxID=1096341 RepID=A0A4R7KAP6_9CLOT|nr:LCP family protein [Fonticella tunisiensis]TDT50835.1 LytR family transcriptional attenuator [Fonticella tunisiensis]
MSERRRKRNKKNKRNKVLIVLTIILAMIVGSAAYGYYTFFGRLQRKELPKTNEELGIQPEAAENKDSNIINIVFFGLDRRNQTSESSRSDSIIVVSIDKTNQKVKMTSLMRDMYVPIPGKGNNRINAAYAFGGPALAVKTINSNFGLDIRDYVTIDFFGLEKLIDKVGGVKINISEAEATYVNGYLAELNRLNGNVVKGVKPGIQVLNGRQAVAYSRIRYVGRGDYERTERQREVLNQLFQKIKAQGTAKIPGLVSELIPYIETSLSNKEIIDLAMEAAKFNTSSIEQFRLPVDGYFKSQNINGMAVLVPDIEANKDKLHEFIYGEK